MALLAQVSTQKLYALVISTPFLNVSSINGTTIGDVTTSQLLSTTEGLGTAGYLSTGGQTNLSSVTTNNLIASSILNYLTISTTSLVVYGTSSIHSTLNIQQQLFFNDLSTGVIGNPIFQSSSLLYYGNSVIGGTNFVTIQTITF